MALESQVLEILRSGHGITSIFSDFNRLASRLTANPIERDTFAIDTADRRSPSGKRPPPEIRAFLEAHSIFKSVAVEIYRILLRSDPRILAALETLRPKIIGEVKASLRLRGSSIEFHSRMVKEEILEEHKLPTVVQFVLPETSYDFTDLEDRLRSTIRSVDVAPIGLDILPGRIDH
ncbi:hypothetical protein MMC22_002003 [Lobaria immixta]|nr:hypothetical protein [Lobaria immixta]